MKKHLDKTKQRPGIRSIFYSCGLNYKVKAYYIINVECVVTDCDTTKVQANVVYLVNTRISVRTQLTSLATGDGFVGGRGGYSTFVKERLGLV